MQLDLDCRENADCAIFLSGPIDAKLVKEVSPEIVKLRARQSERITVYINSDGGYTDDADIIECLLRFRGIEKYAPLVITVAIGHAKSAAATLLALGDYAIAYPHASLHFHGVRYSSSEIEVTTEVARWQAEDLQSQNQKRAAILAKKTGSRAMLIYSMLWQEFGRIREERVKAQGRALKETGNLGRTLGLGAPKPDTGSVPLDAPELSDVECFVIALKDRLVSESAQKIVDAALKTTQEIEQFTERILVPADFARPDSQTQTEIEASMFKLIVDYEAGRLIDKTKGLPADCVARIVADFSLIRDYLWGEHNEHLLSLVKRFGPQFLDEKQAGEYARRCQECEQAKAALKARAEHATNMNQGAGAPVLDKWLEEETAKLDAAVQAWLKETTMEKLQPIWYFIVCLWRALQEGENPLPPADAYWLGIIDEVAGTDLAAYRLAKEGEGAPGTPLPPPASLPAETPESLFQNRMMEGL